MKVLIIGLLFITLIQGLLTFELNISVSSKKSLNFTALLRRFFPQKSADKKQSVGITDRTDTGEVQKSSLEKHDSLACTMCIRQVRMYERIFNHSNTAESIQSVLTGTCDILETRYRNSCITFYKTGGLQVIKDILINVDPRKICQGINICKKKEEESVSMGIISETYFMFEDVSQKPHRCKICQKIVKYTEKIIDSSKSVDFVIQKLTTVCSIYQTKYQARCNGMLKSPVTRQYFKSILAHKCPFKICRDIRACSKIMNDLQDGCDSVAKTAVISPCKLCKQVAYIMDRLTVADRKKAALSDAFDKVCNFVPSNFKEECSNFIADHRENIMDNFPTEVGSDEMCRKLNICNVLKTIQHARPLKDSSLMCSLCQTYVGRYEKILDHSMTPDDVQKSLIGTCDILKTDDRQLCIKFCESKGLQAIKDMLQGVNSTKICQDVDVCRGHGDVGAIKYLFELFAAMKEDKKDTKCKPCQHIVKYLEKVIDETKTADFVTQRLSALCDVTKPQYRAVCRQHFVNSRSTGFIGSILAKKDSLDICRTLELCPNGRKGFESVDSEFFLPKTNIL